MRDISAKPGSLRTAVAEARLALGEGTVRLVREGRAPKGDPLAVARVAAIQAAKDTGRIIPYCHPVPVDFVEVEFDLGESLLCITVEVKAIYRTGVEMEALTAASVAALTVYDMLKMVDDRMAIEGVRLLSKSGGRSDYDRPLDWSPRAAVVVVSDSVAAGRAEDRSGRLIEQRLAGQGFDVELYRVVPDEPEHIVNTLLECADSRRLDLVVTTGGTGSGPRDRTPEALERVVEQRLDSLAEGARWHGMQRTPFAMLSRSAAGIRGGTLIVVLPGSSRAVGESLDALMAPLKHLLGMVRGEGHGDRA